MELVLLFQPYSNAFNSYENLLPNLRSWLMFIYQLFVVTVISQLLKLVLSEENKKKNRLWSKSIYFLLLKNETPALRSGAQLLFVGE